MKPGLHRTLSNSCCCPALKADLGLQKFPEISTKYGVIGFPGS